MMHGLDSINWDNTEGPNVEAKIFYRMLKDCEKSSYSVCVAYTNVPFYSRTVESKVSL